ncbi:hypothetical protein ABZ570_02960 [Micromonospora sp. NPDC007271]|uniref:hypothetical protein n=1 Tax=Micromonospora sp. NPDC007271 TaxID=3154587 RepID=UPI00340AE34C
MPAVAGVAGFAVLPPVVGYTLTARGVGFAARLLAGRAAKTIRVGRLGLPIADKP